ncbi:hypothetical protein Hanom_Chr14g01251991 [Helianthus anomalus]
MVMFIHILAPSGVKHLGYSSGSDFVDNFGYDRASNNEASTPVNIMSNQYCQNWWSQKYYYGLLY